MRERQFNLYPRRFFRGSVIPALVGGLSGLSIAAAVVAAPRTPGADSEVLERLPLRAGNSTRSELAALRAAAQANPADVNAAVRLAERYFDQALAQGDPRYVGHAEAALNKVAGAPSAARLSMQGQLRQYRHDFDGALRDFAAALQLDPTLAEAHAWRSAIFLVQADYPAALVECEALRRLERPVLHAACLGLVQAYRGQLDAAERTFSTALAEAALPESRLWLLTRLGEVAAWRGQSAVAERHYRAALKLGLDDGYLLAAWCDFLLDQGRPAEVVKQLTGWEAADPLLLRLTEAESLLKLPAATAHVQALGERFAAARQRGDTTHLAEEARYHLKLRPDPARAVQLARENYAVQREPRDARVLLDAAIAAGDAQAAQPVRDWLRSTGFEDAQLRRLADASAHAGPASKPAASAPGVSK
jgi:Tfp pilus assembly protein PilF